MTPTPTTATNFLKGKLCRSHTESDFPESDFPGPDCRCIAGVVDWGAAWSASLVVAGFVVVVMAFTAETKFVDDTDVAKDVDACCDVAADGVVPTVVVAEEVDVSLVVEVVAGEVLLLVFAEVLLLVVAEDVVVVDLRVVRVVDVCGKSMGALGS